MVSNLIHIIRGKQVILDSDLAMLYQVETGAMNRAVKRNKKRFPEAFCFQLTEEEFLRCQNGISKEVMTDYKQEKVTTLSELTPEWWIG